MNLQPVEIAEALDEHLVVMVPAFPPGPYPPAVEEWEPLAGEHDHKEDLPIYWRRSLILESVQGEVLFRQEKQAGWFERCWFLLGRILRDPAGQLYAVVTRSVPADNVHASSSFFELTAAAWLSQKKTSEEKGEMLLGWLHTHSMESIRDTCGKNHSTQCLSECTSGAPGEVSERNLPGSGLFLSAEDRESALKHGFNAPWQVTCVLDSDVCACGTPEKDVPLRELLGVWGWYAGLLCRRSVHVIE